MSNMNNKCCQYSFYIPANDQSLCDFLEAQSNLSMSIRLLIKAFLANYGDTIPDVTIVDLKELLNNMQFKEGIIDNIVDYKDNRSKKSADNNMPTIDAQKDDMFGDISEEEINMDVVEETQIDTESENDIKSENDVKSENDIKSENDTESEDVSNIDTKETNFESVNDVSETKYDIPVVEVEPESPKKIINSSRDSYNSRQNAQSAASMDDIMSMLGGE